MFDERDSYLSSYPLKNKIKIGNKQIVEQNALSTQVERCDCFGECGYGPNVMKVIKMSTNNNKVEDEETTKTLINQVRGIDAIYPILGISAPPTPESETTTSNE